MYNIKYLMNGHLENLRELYKNKSKSCSHCGGIGYISYGSIDEGFHHKVCSYCKGEGIKVNKKTPKKK